MRSVLMSDMLHRVVANSFNFICLLAHEMVLKGRGRLHTSPCFIDGPVSLSKPTGALNQVAGQA